MKKLWNKIKSFFLVKKIVSQAGTTHFRRWRLFWTPWLTIYLHQIANSDLGIDKHDHPFNFWSLILKGAYIEDSRYAREDYLKEHIKIFTPGMINKKQMLDCHKLTLLSTTWTLVFTTRRKHYWGYRTENGWVDHKVYNRARKERREKELNEETMLLPASMGQEQYRE